MKLTSEQLMKMIKEALVNEQMGQEEQGNLSSMDLQTIEGELDTAMRALARLIKIQRTRAIKSPVLMKLEDVFFTLKRMKEGLVK